MAYPKNEPDYLPDDEEIKSFRDRILKLTEELDEIKAAIKEVYAEAKGRGFDTKVMREAIRLLKRSREEIDEHREMLDLYYDRML